MQESFSETYKQLKHSYDITLFKRIFQKKTLEKWMWETGTVVFYLTTNHRNGRDWRRFQDLNLEI